jgi:ribosomal protein L37E
MELKQPCPNCSEPDTYDGNKCSDCGYGRTRNHGVIRVTAEEKKRKLDEENLRKDKVRRYVRELQDLPQTKHWNWDKVQGVAELCAMMNLPKADDWFKKKNEVQD